MCLYFIIRLCCFSRCDIFSDFSGVLVMYLLNSVSSVHYFWVCADLCWNYFLLFCLLTVFSLIFFFKSYVHSMILECTSSADAKPSLAHANSTYRGHLCWAWDGYKNPDSKWYRPLFLRLTLQAGQLSGAGQALISSSGLSVVRNPASGVTLRLYLGHMWSQLLLFIPSSTCHCAGSVLPHQLLLFSA